MKPWRRNFHSGVSAWRDNRELSSSLSFSVMWVYKQEVVVCKPGREPSPDTETASTLISDLPASRTVINKCFHLSHLDNGILLQQPELRHLTISNSFNLQLALISQQLPSKHRHFPLKKYPTVAALCRPPPPASLVYLISSPPSSISTSYHQRSYFTGGQTKSQGKSKVHTLKLVAV